MEADIKVFEEDTKFRDYDLAKYGKMIESNKKQLEALMKEKTDMLSDIAEYEKRLKHAEKYLLNLRNRLKEEGVEDDEIEQLGSVKEDELEPVVDGSSKKDGSIKTEDNELTTVEGATADQVEIKEEDDEEVISVDEDNEYSFEGSSEEEDKNEDEDSVMTEEDTEPSDFSGIDDGSEKKEDQELQTVEGSTKDQVEVLEDADDDKMAAVRAAQKGGDPALGSSKKEESKVSKYSFTTLDPKKSLKEKAPVTMVKKPIINKDIVAFYETQVQKTPSLKNFEKQILGSKSLLEAVNKIEKLKEKDDEVVRFDSKEVKTSWIPKGRF